MTLKLRVTFQDLGLLDLEDYRYGSANITAYRLIDPARDKVVNVKTDWLRHAKKGHESPLMGYAEIEVRPGSYQPRVSRDQARTGVVPRIS